MKASGKAPAGHSTKTSRLLIGVLIACTSVTGCNQSKQIDTTGLVLQTLDGRRIAMGPGVPRIVNFWATSCATCIDEMPDLIRFAREHPRVEVIGIAMPYDPPNRVVEMQRALRTPFPIALDPIGVASDRFGGVEATPTTFVVDNKGMVQYRHEGRIDFEVLRTQVARSTTSRGQDTGKHCEDEGGSECTNG